MDRANVTACNARRPANTLPPPSADFKDAMSRLAGAVGVAACWSGGFPVGLLVSSIAALSLEPPRVLFCVKKTTLSHNALFHARECSLSVLAEHDHAEAERFAGPPRSDDQFDPSVWALDQKSPPRHRSALVGMVGTIAHRMDAGAHTAFVLNVRDADVSDAEPLIYFRRGFAGLRPLGEA